jgi:AMIN domain-containing protein
MSPAWGLQAPWPAPGKVAPFLVTAAFFLLVGLVLPKTSEAVELELTAVSVEQQDDALTVRLHTSRPPRYRASTLGAPARIVIDLDGARQAWNGPLTTNPEPIREVRASQWKPDTARVVVELSRPVGYSIEELPDGLILKLDAGAGGRVAQIEPSTAVESAAARLLSKKEAPPVKTSQTGATIKGQVEIGYRGFVFGRGQSLDDNNVDLMGELDFTYDFSRALRLRLHPRVAIDALEPPRDRFAPYDAYVEYTADSWALLAGQLIESWSAVEMFSPADLLNRRDLERNFYNPEKLGELMLRLRLSLPEGEWIRQPTFSLYALPLFRNTPLPTNHDRFRFDLTGDNVGDLSNKTVQPSFDVGFAARATATIGRADLALFYYGGPGRIPSFALDPRYQTPRLTPVYYRTDSVGASAQGALGPWVLKGETVYTHTSTSGLPGSFKGAVPDSYFQYVVGVDRTFTDVLGKNEVTVTLEYSGENKPQVTSLTGIRPFKSDFFLSARWQFNDQRRTQLQAFLAADVLKSEQLWLVDFKTTLHGNLKLLIEGQFVNRGESTPPNHLSVFGAFPNNTNLRAAFRYEF